MDLLKATSKMVVCAAFMNPLDGNELFQEAMEIQIYLFGTNAAAALRLHVWSLICNRRCLGLQTNGLAAAISQNS